MDIKKTCCDIGHNLPGVDVGADGILFEDEVVRAVGEEFMKLCAANGLEFVNCTPTSAKDVGESLSYRVQVANKSPNIDFFMSIHANKFNGQAHGVEVFAISATDIAKKIADNISKLGFTNRGVKDGSGLYVVAHTAMPAVLIELFFVDNRDDVDLYKKLGPSAIATAILSALLPDNEIKPYVRVSQPIPDIDIAKIKDVQNTLNAMGFKDGSGFSLTVDGIWGPKSTYAMKLCQSVLNVPETGTFDNITIEAMKSVLFKPLLQEGIKGVPVRFIQWKVGAVRDGDFGPMTKARVQNYQNEHGLEADGIVGDMTWQEMIKEIK